MKTELSKAIEVLCKALAEDKSEGSYYFGWQANIAMCIMDEKKRYEEKKWMEVIPKSSFAQYDFCNDSAKKFLDLLIATTLDKESLNHEDDDLTSYESFQKEKYGNIIPETEPEEPHEENR